MLRRLKQKRQKIEPPEKEEKKIPEKKTVSKEPEYVVKKVAPKVQAKKEIVNEPTYTDEQIIKKNPDYISEPKQRNEFYGIGIVGNNDLIREFKGIVKKKNIPLGKAINDLIKEYLIKNR